MNYSKAATTLIISITLCGCQSEETKHSYPKRPNILFAIADDASWQHFGAYGCEWVKTPAFDRIAREGLLFTHAYTPNAKCAPSRSCILTGRNSWQLEEAANHSPLFPAHFKTFMEALSDQGYQTGFTAKGWAPGDPGTINGKRRELTGQPYNEHKTTPPARHISNNDYAANFRSFLEARHDNTPFCFWYGSTEPHRAYEFGAGINYGDKTLDEIDKVPDFWPDVDTIRTDMLDYAFELEYFDQHLQRMLEHLDSISELDNTIVVVTSDNGMPFPRIKGQVYEYSNHLPLAIMWPKGIQNPGRIINDYISFIDFAPTFLDLAEVTPDEAGMQPVTGKSLTGYFTQDKQGLVFPERDYVLVGKERHDVGRPNDEGYPVRGIFKNDYLYLRNYEPERWPKGNPETGYLNCDGSPTKTYILDSRRKKGIMEFWELNFGKRPEEELYHIGNDPYCMDNLATDESFSALKTEMEQELVKRLREEGDPRITGNGHVFDKYPYNGEVKNYYNRYMTGEKVPAGWVNPTDYDEYLKEKNE